MKNRFILLSFFLITIQFAYANPVRKNRKGNGPYFYARAEGAYNLKMASMSAESRTTTSTGGAAPVTTFQSVPFSLGSGITAGVAGGYMFNNNIGFELNLSYLIGSAQTLTNNSTTNSAGTNSTLETYTANMFIVNPMLVLQVHTGGAMSVYTRFGPVIGLAPTIAAENTSIALLDTNGSGKLAPITTIEKRTSSGGIALGFKAAGGVIFEVSPTVAINIEINYMALSYAPDQEILTSSKTGERNNLTGLTVSQTQTSYVDSYSTATVSDPTQPQQALKLYYPFSNLGLQAGIRISFGR